MSGGAYPPINDYGLIGDMRSCALVSRDGSVDFACFPRFDSPATFGRILDWQRGGFFQLRPSGTYRVTRRYVPDTNVLETTFQAQGGTATLTDFMPVDVERHSERPASGHHQKIARIFACTHGSIQFELVCRPRFDYGTIVPNVHLEAASGAFAHGGADAISLYCSAALRIEDDGFAATGRLAAGEKLYAVASHEESFSHETEPIDDGEVERWLGETLTFWREWAGKATYTGPYRDEVVRSALVLKALTYAPSGAMIAAPTTSLPERIGGNRNWDYRFAWIRDATLALYSLYILGYTAEAEGFNRWLEWSTLGRARDLQPLYGISGERRLVEIEISALSGYRDSAPVRIGNSAVGQFQLDIYGELLDSAHQFRKFGGEITAEYWQYLQRIVSFVIEHWQEPDEGIWETRGGRQHFVSSKVMCWVALDRAIKAAAALGLPGDVDAWRACRLAIRRDIEANGYDASRGAFVQHYGSRSLDASNLLLPLVGFMRADDPRMRGTIEATARELTSPEGCVYRYREFDDGVGGTEGTFLICTHWLADNYIMLGEHARAQELFDLVRSCANDLGLFGEQYDPATGDILGNFPQAFSHLGLINTAVMLESGGRKRQRAAG